MTLRYDQPDIKHDSGWRYDSGAARQRKGLMIKPSLKLKAQKDIPFVEYATAVANAMTAHAGQYPNSAATVALLVTAIAAYAAALQAVVDGKLTQQGLVDAKNAARVAVEQLLRILAGQVNEVAQGDINLIHEAGMQASTEPAPVLMPQVVDLQLTPSKHDGELLAKWKPVADVRFYDVQVCLDATTVPTNWQDKLNTTKAKCKLNDTLVSGQKVWARVRAVGARDEGPWSDPAWKTVP